MADALLVLNGGSSNWKLGLYRASEDGSAALTLAQERPDLAGAIAVVRGWLLAPPDGLRVVGVGHRVVHGGPAFHGPVRVDDATLRTIEALVPLAPLHQPQCVAAIRAVTESEPWLPQVACFDTVFHRTQPSVAQAFALPRPLSDAGVRRYGFHGLSFESIATRLPDIAPTIARGRVVIAHLGNGASLCALGDGRSVATTMGLTPLDGLMMGTRSGALDPGVLLYLMDTHGMDARGIEDLLYRRSGLLGVSGVASDMRALLASDDPRAREAIELFVYRITRELGAMAAALGGLDALVFTGGIGEHAAPIRARVCAGAAWLGVRLDDAANTRGGPCISAQDATASAWVIATDENAMIARHSLALLRAEEGASRG